MTVHTFLEFALYNSPILEGVKPYHIKIGSPGVLVFWKF